MLNFKIRDIENKFSIQRNLEFFNSIGRFRILIVICIVSLDNSAFECAYENSVVSECNVADQFS